MSSSQVIFYVHILKKSKRGNILYSLRPDVLQANTRKKLLESNLMRYTDGITLYKSPC